MSWACDRCLALPGGAPDGCTLEGDCRRASPLAQAKSESRTGQTRPYWSPSECWASEVRRRAELRGEVPGVFTFRSAVPILKWHYPQVGWGGTYLDRLMGDEQHRYEVRVESLRGGPEPRSRSEMEDLIPGLKTGRREGGVFDVLCYEAPAWALTRKSA